MQKRWFCPLLMGWITACASVAVRAEQQQEPFWQGTYVQADVQAWSNGMPVMDMDGPWQSGYQRQSGVQRAYQTALLEMGMAFAPGIQGMPGTWRLGLLRRAEAFVSMSGDTAELLALYRRRSDPDTPMPLDLDHRALAWQGRGIRLQMPALALNFPNCASAICTGMKLDMSLQWLSLNRLRTTSSVGDAVYEGSGSYAYQASLQDDNSRARFPFMAASASSGHGVSLSWGAQGQAPAWGTLGVPPMTWALSVSDAWSRLMWRGVNGSDGSLTSQVTTKTADGYINYEPAVQTSYTQRPLQARIPTGVDVHTAWQAKSGDWSVHLNRRWGLYQTWLGWQHRGVWRWQVAIEPSAQALQVGLDYHGLSVRALADRMGKSAHVQGVTVSYAWQAH